MKCSNCNIKNPEGSKFCSHCGEILKEESIGNLKIDDTATPKTLYNTVIIISVVIGISIIVYALLDYSYKNNALKQKIQSEEKAKMEKKFEEADKEQKYNKCKASAWENFDINWNSNCETQNLEEDCSLRSDLADKLNKTRTDEIDNCYKVIYQK